jgi:integrase
MSILAECPCHRKQSIKNRICCACGGDLVKAKQRRKVRYWVVYRLPNGKQRKEFVGNDSEGRPLGIEEARAADGKHRAQKKENPSILEVAPAQKWTFIKLADWYLEQKDVTKLSSFNRIRGILANFNSVYGDRIVSTIKLQDLVDYQEKREEEGRAAATIDMEISIVKTMVTKAFDNDLVDGRTLKAFRPVKRKLRRGANARHRTLTVEEYLKLVAVAAPHLKGIIITAFNTGMRLGELLGRRWSYINREKGVIRLPADVTKESKPKVIPVNHHVHQVLEEIRREVVHIEYVFTYRLEPIGTLGGIKKSFATACEKAGIIRGRSEADGLTFHDIRGTFKTNMLKAGVDKAYRDVILGHSLKGMDVHYLRLSEDDLHRAMGKFTAWLDAQIQNVAHSVAQVNES